MDIGKAKLEELLLILEIKRLGLTTPDNFENIWTGQEIYEKIADYSGISSQNPEKLYEWLKEKARYPLLNELIKLTLLRLIRPLQTLSNTTVDITDYFIIDNLKQLIQIMDDMTAIWETMNSEKSTPLSKITKQEMNNLIIEILIEIDPSLHWKHLYQKALQTKKIIFLNELSEEEKQIILKKTDNDENLCIHDDQGNPYIIVNLTGTIKDVYILLHEFIHYISFYKNRNKKIPRTLLEFPSIFYELYTLSFLERKGYSKAEIDSMNTHRIENTVNLSINITVLCYYISIFLDNSEITEEEDIRAKKISIQQVASNISRDVKDSLEEINLDLSNAQETAHASCDECIQQLILYPEYFYKFYPYIIGNYLAIQTMKLKEDILTKMKQITENLASINPAIVFKMVGYNLENLEEKKEKKTLHFERKN